MKSIAFIGLGNMGLPMVANLVKAGYRVHAADVRPRPSRPRSPRGPSRPSPRAEPRARRRSSSRWCRTLPRSRSRTWAPAECSRGHGRGQIAIDMSTIDPATTRKVGARLDAAGVRMLDAPVSGGVPGAVAGTLTIMVGGDPAVFAEARPILGRDGQERRPRGPARLGRGGQDLQQPPRRGVHDRGRRGLHDRDPGGGRPEDPPRGDPDQLGQLLGAWSTTARFPASFPSPRRTGTSRPAS